MRSLKRILAIALISLILIPSITLKATESPGNTSLPLPERRNPPTIEGNIDILTAVQRVQREHNAPSKVSDAEAAIAALLGDADGFAPAQVALVIDSIMRATLDLYVEYLIDPSKDTQDPNNKSSFRMFRSALSNLIKHQVQRDLQDGVFKSPERFFQETFDAANSQEVDFWSLASYEIPNLIIALTRTIIPAAMDPSVAEILSWIRDTMLEYQKFNDDVMPLPPAHPEEEYVDYSEYRLDMSIVDLFFTEFHKPLEDAANYLANQLNLAITRENESDFVNRAGTIVEALAYVHIPSLETIAALSKERGLTMDDLYLGNVWLPKEGTDFASTLANRRLNTTDVDQGVMMQDLYLKMFAATAMYIPFQSKVADRLYMDTVRHLYFGVDDSRMTDDLLLVGELLQYSKPLYAINANHVSYPQEEDGFHNKAGGMSRTPLDGSVQRVTLGDLINAIQRGASLYAGVLPGQLIPKDGTWVYEGNVVEEIDGEVTIIPVTYQGEHFSNTLGATIFTILEVESDGSAAFGEGNFLQTITNMFSQPGGDYEIWTNPSPGNLTAGILTNIYLNLTNKSVWELRSTEILFLNAVGDIHLADGTIILPAAANPVYQWNPSYAVAQGEHVLTQTSGSDIYSTSSSLAWYNPFTAAFMNNYPTISGSSTMPTLLNPNDRYKWHLIREAGTSPSNISSSSPGSSSKNQVSFVPINTDGFINYKAAAREADPDARVDLSPGFNLWQVFSAPGYTSNPEAFFEILKAPVRYDNTGVIQVSSGLAPIRVHAITLDLGAQAVFPYDSSNQEAANIIAQNFYQYIRRTGSGSENTEVPQGSGRLREPFLFSEVLLPVMQGTSAPGSYYRESEFYRRSDDDAGFASGAAFTILGTLIDFLGDLRSFIGIPTSGDNSVMTIIYDTLIRFWYIIAIIFMLVFIYIFIMGRSLLQSIYGVIILVVGVWGFLFILPRTLPIVTIPLIKPFVTDLATNAVIVRAEQFEDVNNMNKEHSTSLLISELGMARAADIHDGDFMTSRTEVLPQAGIYLQGTQLRLNLDYYFMHNKLYTEHVRSMKVNQERLLSPIMGYESNLDPRRVFGLEPRLSEPNSIQLLISNPYPAPEYLHYYTPLLVMQEGLVNTLNRFLANFRVPQSLIIDANNIPRESYIMPNFIHSYPFLAILPAVQAQLGTYAAADSNLRHVDQININAILAQDFPNLGDIMQLQWLVDHEWWELPISIQNTIWLQTMIRNGYYDPEVGKTKRQFLVNITNDAAYSYLVSNSRQVGIVSDDTLIKMTVLMAAMQFNEEISSFGTQVYPHYFTISDLSIRDILQSSILQGSDRFVYYDTNLIHNVFVTRGIPGMISLLLLTIAMAVISIVNTFVFPVLYVASVVCLILLMLMRKNTGNLTLAGVKVILLNLAANLIGTGLFAIYRAVTTVYDIHILAVLMIALAVAVIVFLIKIVKSVDFKYASKILSIEKLIEKRNLRNRKVN